MLFNITPSDRAFSLQRKMEVVIGAIGLLFDMRDRLRRRPG